ncbi:hypothetical protein F66182_4568 [Fusarium sp. NRRL 66182]|nr:hypothetical protein F66182_4568 [Fusarium sp. NRRL 66182]
MDVSKIENPEQPSSAAPPQEEASTDFLYNVIAFAAFMHPHCLYYREAESSSNLLGEPREESKLLREVGQFNYLEAKLDSLEIHLGVKAQVPPNHQRERFERLQQEKPGMREFPDFGDRIKDDTSLEAVLATFHLKRLGLGGEARLSCVTASIECGRRGLRPPDHLPDKLEMVFRHLDWMGGLCMTITRVPYFTAKEKDIYESYRKFLEAEKQQG